MLEAGLTAPPLLSHSFVAETKQELTLTREQPVETYDFTETHEHPEGGDRGGYAPETHTFRVFANGRVEHDYSLDCNDGDPGCFGLDEGTLERLSTKEDALCFVNAKLAEVRERLQELETLQQKLEATADYVDSAEYSGYEEEEDEYANPER